MSASPEFSLTQLSRTYGVTPRAIRHYDDVGLIKPHRNRANRRRLDLAERDRLLFILRLREAGLGLDEIRRIVAVGRRHGPSVQLTCACAALNDRIVDLECAFPPRPASVKAAVSVLQALETEMAA
ncbi:MAG: MerR family transcriptional regulator [Phenylobacterium sp.]|uniref:MerR family transcriptional regulator n=1 Tax=Phenylobacterium sp. TaxID=1871053 RepID=UPI00273265F4|nr:MerR family transcriptional regulator [Phenylobacterium sp.]MDP3746368.1 MerR family transcriptional regulator [Phenylobacterium sp.]